MANRSKRVVFCSILLFLFPFVRCQSAHFDYFAPEIPSQMPSSHFPATLKSLTRSRQDIGTGVGGGEVIPPPQNNPVDPLGPPSSNSPNGLPDGFVPFGLNHVLLILIPKFITTCHMLPDWLHSTIEISMPITIFFDQLTVPPGMFVPIPGLFGEPVPLPLGAPLPIGFRPLPPSPVLPISSPPPHPVVLPTPTTQFQTTSFGHYPPHQASYTSSYQTSGHEVDLEEPYDSEEEADYENYSQEQETKGRWKRASLDNTTLTRIKWGRKLAAINFNETIYAAERAVLFPTLVDLLENGGFVGKPCFLRTICEVHEAPLTHYGLLGELVTMFFSASRSVFAQSHLSEYLRAEKVGKSGDCTEYFKNCDHSIFSWEEVKSTKEKAPFVFNVIDEVW